jgi:hypothetical protein
MMRLGKPHGFGFIGAITILAAVVPLASAALSEVVLRIGARTASSDWVFVQFTQSDGWWDGDMFTVEYLGVVPILDESGNLIATFGPAAIASYVDPEHAGRSLPQASIGFAMQADAVPAMFQVQSAFLSYSPLHNPEGRATVGITVADSTGDGATLLGNGPNGGAYLAQYNGFVPGGTTFSEAISRVDVAPFDIANADSDTGWQPIAGPVGDMSTLISFTLSPGDLASGTCLFQLTPEPATGLLLIAALASSRRP